MKTIRLVVVFLVIAMAGCATADRYDDTVTGGVAGGLIGGAISGNKGAVTGGLLGAGIGVLSDAKNRKDAVREQRINQMINAQTQGVGVAGRGNAQVAGAVAETQKNIAFAKGERDKCQTKFAIYKQAGIKKPYNCEQVFNDALRLAEDASAIADPLQYNSVVYGGGCIGRYLRANSIRPGHSRIIMWRERARNKCQRGGYSYGYR